MKNNCIKCFKALSAKTRFKIFQYLIDAQSKGKKVVITDLVKYSVLRQPTVSFHIDKLVSIGLIKKTKVGRSIYCKINNPCPNCILFYS